MKATERQVELVRKVGEIRNWLNWEETADPKSFQATLGTTTIAINEDTDPNDDEIYNYLQVLNKSGTVVDSLYSYSLSQGGLTSADSILSDIYDSARRIALKADETIATAIRELDDIIPF